MLNSCRKVFFVFLFLSIVALSLLSINSQAQTKSYSLLLKTQATKSIQTPVQTMANQTNYKRFIKGNFLSYFTQIPLVIYQHVISEQLSTECGFEPSCSQFAKEMIVKQPFTSLFLIADRLTRCNGLSQTETEDYLINHRSAKVIDRTEMYVPLSK